MATKGSRQTQQEFLFSRLMVSAAAAFIFLGVCPSLRFEVIMKKIRLEEKQSPLRKQLVKGGEKSRFCLWQCGKKGPDWEPEAWSSSYYSSANQLCDGDMLWGRNTW
uniref:Adaptor related protein complex 3 subunit sigma 1 n=1 Tax=Molossus molossus TaxID=27622 RepID=A0A7J8IWJ4_MOLMO|nr:adaptor related protein complex 3 subunit sigma 1 [Molossus molossus]